MNDVSRLAIRIARLPHELSFGRFASLDSPVIGPLDAGCAGFLSATRIKTLG